MSQRLAPKSSGAFGRMTFALKVQKTIRKMQKGAHDPSKVPEIMEEAYDTFLSSSPDIPLTPSEIRFVSKFASKINQFLSIGTIGADPRSQYIKLLTGKLGGFNLSTEINAYSGAVNRIARKERVRAEH